MLLKNRIRVFVDGNNTYHLIRRTLPRGVRMQKFDYRQMIVDAIGKDTLSGYQYYIGRVHAIPGDERSRKLFFAQQRLFEHLLTKEQDFSLRLGDVVLGELHYQEKGVDVLLAIDLVIQAVRDEYDTAVLLSSDADFAPAVDFVCSLGKKVVYLGFDDGRSQVLTKHASQVVIIRQDTIKRCLTAEQT